MPKNYSTISVENSTCEAVNKIIEKHLGTSFFDSELPHICGMHLEIVDVRSEIEYSKQFLNDNQLQDENQFYRDFNMDSFNIEVSFYHSVSMIGKELQPILTDIVGRIISKELKTKTVIILNNGEVPFCLYYMGIREKIFSDYYKDYFKNRNWQPTTDDTKFREHHK